MLYQTLLMGERPYYVNVGTLHKFEEHRHSEIEMIYCTEGYLDITVERTSYRVEKGQFVFISSMASHEVPESGKNRHLILEVGPVLLSEYFEALAAKKPTHPVFFYRDNPKFCALVEETEELCLHPGVFSELSVHGNIFKICALVMEQLVSENADTHTSKGLRSVANIENALHRIHTRFEEPLSVADMAELCGYSKSNFCKIFKNITGETFHNYLNGHRIDVAKKMLSETDFSVEQIAVQSGFADAKSLCRVFKQRTGKSPGAYRRYGNIQKALL